MPSCVQILKERDVGGVARLGNCVLQLGKLESGGGIIFGGSKGNSPRAPEDASSLSLCGRVHSRRVPGYSRSQRRSRIC